MHRFEQRHVRKQKYMAYKGFSLVNIIKYISIIVTYISCISNLLVSPDFLFQAYKECKMNRFSKTQNVINSFLRNVLFRLKKVEEIHQNIACIRMYRKAMTNVKMIIILSEQHSISILIEIICNENIVLI